MRHSVQGVSCDMRCAGALSKACDVCAGAAMGQRPAMCVQVLLWGKGLRCVQVLLWEKVCQVAESVGPCGAGARRKARGGALPQPGL